MASALVGGACRGLGSRGRCGPATARWASRGNELTVQKNYNLIVEPWRGNRRMGGFTGRPGYRWKVTWRLDGEFYAEGFEDTHAAARAAAEKFLEERGVELMPGAKRWG